MKLSVPIVSVVRRWFIPGQRFWDGLYRRVAVHGRDPRPVRASGLRLIEKVNCRFAARGVEPGRTAILNNNISLGVGTYAPRIHPGATRDLNARSSSGQ